MDDVGLPAQLEAAGVVVAGIADLVVSNGVFNLCVDKRQAFLNVRILIKCSTYSDFVLQMYLGTNFFFWRISVGLYTPQAWWCLCPS